MIDGAEERGDLDPGVTVIEPTSGNTGSEIARLAGSRGYDVEIVMPDNAAGGKVDAVATTPARRSTSSTPISATTPSSSAARRSSPKTPRRTSGRTSTRTPTTRYPRAHDRSRDLRGDGRRGDPLRRRRRYRGTITGTGRGLTDLSDGAVEIVGFEPDEQLHAIDGLKYLKSGDHYHPDTYDESALDRTEYVTTSDAYDRARALRERYLNREIEIADPGQHDEATIREHLRVDDQFVVGTSAGGGAAAVAGLDEAGALADDDVVVFMLCDRGDKYADIPLWEEYL